jgi:alpha-amylase
MAVGEFWDTCEYTDGVLNYNQDSHRQRTVSWCDQTGGTSAAFDFTLKGGLSQLKLETGNSPCDCPLSQVASRFC